MKHKLAVGLATILVSVALVGWWLACPGYVDPATIKDSGREPGALIAVDSLGGHNKLVLRALLWWANLPVATTVSDGAEMFRIKYWSEIDGRPVEASGLLSLPYATFRGRHPRGTVMYLHGTSPDRSASPSAPGVEEGVLPSALFAGGGYTLLAPDYFGLGQSRADQAYLHAKATVAAARDLVVAARHVTAAMNVPFSADLYLVGFSQGGHATAVVQRAFETRPPVGVRVKAAAAISGAFDLVGVSVPYAFQHKHSLYLSYLAYSYAMQYHQPLNSLLVPRYAALVPTLFDGDHSVDSIATALPADPRALFRPEALAEIVADKPNWFTAALAANEGYRWRPLAPLRLYYGDRDEDVSPRDSRNFYAVASKLGGNITLVPLGPYLHGETALHGVPLARIWFDDLSKPASDQ